VAAVLAAVAGEEAAGTGAWQIDVAPRREGGQEGMGEGLSEGVSGVRADWVRRRCG